jgi:hypothetical protein
MKKVVFKATPTQCEACQADSQSRQFARNRVPPECTTYNTPAR